MGRVKIEPRQSLSRCERPRLVEPPPPAKRMKIAGQGGVLEVVSRVEQGQRERAPRDSVRALTLPTQRYAPLHLHFRFLPRAGRDVGLVDAR